MLRPQFENSQRNTVPLLTSTLVFLPGQRYDPSPSTLSNHLDHWGQKGWERQASSSDLTYPGRGGRERLGLGT